MIVATYALIAEDRYAQFQDGDPSHVVQIRYWIGPGSHCAKYGRHHHDALYCYWSGLIFVFISCSLSTFQTEHICSVTYLKKQQHNMYFTTQMTQIVFTLLVFDGFSTLLLCIICFAFFCTRV